MDISIITRHNIINYGSLLQTIALQEVLNRMGHTVNVIDYIRNDEDYRYIAKVLVKRNNKWNSNALFRIFFVVTKALEFYISGKTFEKYRNLYLNLTPKRYVSFDDLCVSPPNAEVYITGSDQVWGGIGNDKYDPAFFLKFGDSSIRRVSYSSSFGRINFAKDILIDYANLLSNYDAISVRERSAKELVSRLGFPTVEQVLDPTLLILPCEWDKILGNDSISSKVPSGKYILVYQRRPNKQIDEYSKRISNRTGMPIYRISSDIHQAILGGRLVYLPNLREFISWIRNASFLLTDSFHGTAFAINYNVQFANILPKGTETRNLSILELTGLADRVVYDLNDFSVVDQIIDYNKVNPIVDRERQFSFRFLRDNLIEGK